ncbi:hypothetical protein [Dictyobacter arantiisoli]|uniref:Uncharacterized protein n=1 Tax=Dictyobacter arantiisoli TaxID=2014874 RepID=A0A5A5THW1_9CHLR|nr:hypothetical protein [Dictyobacter arantiisoli]GCF10892.1 hypothetical protein KDI_44560 [Dictyobacter arantiisoli]
MLHEHASSEEIKETRFVAVDSIASIVSDLLAAGYSAYMVAGGFRTTMPDDELRAFLAQRGFVRDEPA